MPDTFVSLDVQAPDDLWEKRNRSYFLSEFGKPPDIAVEIVSNTKGGERGKKISDYAQAGVRYYIIFDPQRLIQKNLLRIYELSGKQYIPKIDRHLAKAGLGVTLWEGIFEEKHNTWLRWTDRDGNLVHTGKESAKAADERAKAADERVKAERERADRLAAKLRELGISPE